MGLIKRNRNREILKKSSMDRLKSNFNTGLRTDSNFKIFILNLIILNSQKMKF